MRPSVAPTAGRVEGPARSTQPSRSGVPLACVLGGLAGLFHARGAPMAHVWLAVALGAVFGMVLAVRGGSFVEWWTVLCTALVIAICARFYAGWAISRQESLAQRCSFVLAVLAVGAKLCVARCGIDPAGRAMPALGSSEGAAHRSEHAPVGNDDAPQCDVEREPSRESRGADPGADGGEEMAPAAPCVTGTDTVPRTAPGGRRILVW